METIPFERYQGRVFARGAYGAPTIALPSRRTFLLGAFVALLALLWFTGVIDHQHALMGGGVAAGMGRVDYSEFNASPATARIGNDVAKLREDAKALLTAGRAVDGTITMGAEKIGELRKLNDAIAEKAKVYDDALAIDRMAFENDKGLDNLNAVRRPFTGDLGGPSDDRPQMKSFAQSFKGAAKRIAEIGQFASRGSASFELARVNAGMGVVDADGVKTLMTLSSIAPQADRQPGYMPSAQFLSDVTPLFLQGTTDRNSVEFELETTYTSNAAEVAEGTANTDSALAFTNTTFPVRDINAWIPVGRQTLNDNAGLMSYIQGRLLHMLDVRRSSELMAGGGSGSDITGVISFSGIQSQARGTDDNIDAIFKAITLVRTTGDAEPDALVIHAQNWQTIRLARTDNGLYIWGQPNEVGPSTIFGLQVKVSNSVTQNTGVVGAYGTYAQVFYNGGTVVEVSTEHSTYFTERKAAVLASQQLALANYRGTAFCKITSMN